MNNNLVDSVALRWTLKPNHRAINHGQRIDIKCSADGSPKPKIEWFKLINDNESK